MLKGPILWAIAMETEEYVSPIMACTWTGFVQISSKTEFSFPLTSVIATRAPIVDELQVSNILNPSEIPGSKVVLLLISSIAKIKDCEYWNALKSRLIYNKKN